MRKTLVTLGMVLVFLISYKCFLASLVMRCPKTPNILKGFTELLLPPPDLYSYIAKETFDLSCAGKKTSMKFTHRYEGGYEVDLLMPGYFQEFTGEKLKTKLIIRMEFVVDGKTIMTKSTKAPYDTFLSVKNGGAILTTYIVGKELPVAKEIECRIWTVVCDQSLVGKTNHFELAIRRYYNL